MAKKKTLSQIIDVIQRDRAKYAYRHVKDRQSLGKVAWWLSKSSVAWFIQKGVGLDCDYDDLMLEYHERGISPGTTDNEAHLRHVKLVAIYSKHEEALQAELKEAIDSFLE